MNHLKFVFVLLSLAANCSGQGTVYFANRIGVDPAVDTLVFVDFVGGTPLVGTQYAAELYYGAAGADPSSLTPLPTSLTSFRDPSTPSPGTWIGKYVDLPIGGVGAPVTLNVRVWDTTVSSSFEEVSAKGLGRFGQSGT